MDIEKQVRVAQLAEKVRVARQMVTISAPPPKQEEIKKSVFDEFEPDIIEKAAEDFVKTDMTAAGGTGAMTVPEGNKEEIQKARITKYFKREGTPGNYTYYYTEEEWKKGQGTRMSPDVKAEAERQFHERKGSKELTIMQEVGGDDKWDVKKKALHLAKFLGVTDVGIQHIERQPLSKLLPYLKGLEQAYLDKDKSFEEHHGVLGEHDKHPSNQHKQFEQAYKKAEEYFSRAKVIPDQDDVIAAMVDFIDPEDADAMTESIRQWLHKDKTDDWKEHVRLANEIRNKFYEAQREFLNSTDPVKIEELRVQTTQLMSEFETHEKEAKRLFKKDNPNYHLGKFDKEHLGLKTTSKSDAR